MLAPETVAQAHKVIAVGSLSFSLASKLLPRNSRQGIVVLYRFCRYCDDEIDSIPQDAPFSVKEQVLARLRANVHAAWQGKYIDNGTNDDAVFSGLTWLFHTYQIPVQYPLDLLDGMEMDSGESVRISNLDELDLYCYRVAGVVGLMFCHICGVSDKSATKFAVALGKAMQVTNILRDVREDAINNRVYIPASILQTQGLNHDDILKRSEGSKARVISRTLFEIARCNYALAREGFRFLPLRACAAAAAAACIYGHIGKIVVGRRGDPWRTRAVVSFPRKLLLLLKGACITVSTIPWRLRNPFRPAVLSNKWSPS